MPPRFLSPTTRLPHSAMPFVDTSPVTVGQMSLKDTGIASAIENLPAKQPLASISALNFLSSIHPLMPASMVSDASSEPTGIEPFRPNANFRRAPKSIAPADE